jgi:hypothetical protein
MRKFTLLSFLFVLACLKFSCKKDIGDLGYNENKSYTSVEDFFSQNGVPLQTYSIPAFSGGSITTPQGTIISIPPMAFMTLSGAVVAGNVTIEFKDIYKKSDMVLSRMPTTQVSGSPLRSGGEFYFKASQGGSTLRLKPGKSIRVSQPTYLTGGFIPQNPMMPFVWADNQSAEGWDIARSDSLFNFGSTYVYQIFALNPGSQGGWYNSDDYSLFLAYNQNQISFNPDDDPFDFGTEVYLIFSGINTVVKISYMNSHFPYLYAPEGLPCTMVAAGVKNGKLFSSFIPITVSPNLSVNFSLTETTTADFIAALKGLN